MEYRISDLLDFDTPDVGHEDRAKRNVCGCCGTYYVVGYEEPAEIQEIASNLYEACKEVVKAYKCSPTSMQPLFWLRCLQAIAKAEGKK